ncbi:hypothetical protein D3C78_1773900 [compost metagenome]
MIELEEGGGISLSWDVKAYFVRGYNDDSFDAQYKDFYTPYIDNFKHGYGR